MEDNFWKSNDCEVSSWYPNYPISKGEMDTMDAIRDLELRISELEKALNLDGINRGDVAAGARISGS